MCITVLSSSLIDLFASSRVDIRYQQRPSRLLISTSSSSSSSSSSSVNQCKLIDLSPSIVLDSDRFSPVTSFDTPGGFFPEKDSRTFFRDAPGGFLRWTAGSTAGSTDGSVRQKLPSGRTCDHNETTVATEYRQLGPSMEQSARPNHA